MFVLSRLITLGIIFSWFTVETVANTYKPNKRKEQQQTQSTTNRGCGKSVAQFQVLAPSDHIGKTTSKEPTFIFWFSELPENPLNISVTQPSVADPLWRSTLKVDKKGIVSLQLPQSVSLKNEEFYVLTAELPMPTTCSVATDSSSFVRVVFQKVTLTNKLSNSESNSFSEKGIWYDALAENLTSPTKFTELLEQVGISLPNTPTPLTNHHD